MKLTVVQALPALESGGVERGAVEVAEELARLGHRAIVVSAGGRLVARLEAAGAEHVPLSIGRKTPSTLRHVFALRQLLARSGADILHVRSRLPAWVGYLAWRSMPRARRPRFVTTVHGPYSPGLYSAVMARGERVIAISEFIRDYVLEHFPAADPGRIRVIQRGVSPGEFPFGHRPDPAWQAGFLAERPELRGRMLITLPARITRWKGQQDFVELMRLIRERGLDAHGLMVGRADPRRARFVRELEAAARAQGVSTRISLLGQRDDVREIMAFSSVVVSLAREPEAFGRGVLEALSLGVPVVAYDHGGAGEVLRRILPAGLVARGDVRGAADRVAAFCASRPEIPARHPFTLQRMLDATLALYAELAAERSRA